MHYFMPEKPIQFDHRLEAAYEVPTQPLDYEEPIEDIADKNASEDGPRGVPDSVLKFAVIIMAAITALMCSVVIGSAYLLWIIIERSRIY